MQLPYYFLRRKRILLWARHTDTMSHSASKDLFSPLPDNVQLAWEFPPGNTNVQQSRGIAIGARGLRVFAPHAVVPRTHIWFRCSTGFSGSASVRECTRTNGGVHVVLEFLGGLVWKAPALPNMSNGRFIPATPGGDAHGLVSRPHSG
jgi:hypothetical protein